MEGEGTGREGRDGVTMSTDTGEAPRPLCGQQRKCGRGEGLCLGLLPSTVEGEVERNQIIPGNLFLTMGEISFFKFRDFLEIGTKRLEKWLGP